MAVLSCGSAVELPWADRVRGILYMGLPGDAGGEAIERLLFGQANPSGKLAESWPMQYSDSAVSEHYGERDRSIARASMSATAGIRAPEYPCATPSATG